MQVSVGTMASNEMSPDQLVDLLNEFNGKLMATSIAEIMAYLQEQDISPPRFIALQILDTHPGITITPLAKKLKLSLGSASQLIDRLEHDGLVVRQEIPHDRRVRRIFLLDKGRAIIHSVHAMTQVKLVAHLSNAPYDLIKSLYTAVANVMPYLTKEDK